MYFFKYAFFDDSTWFNKEKNPCQNKVHNKILYIYI